MVFGMSEPWPDEAAGDRSGPPPPRPLSTEEQAVVFRAQLFLFIVMGIFIVTPFVVWWWLSRNK